MQQFIFFFNLLSITSLYYVGNKKNTEHDTGINVYWQPSSTQRAYLYSIRTAIINLELTKSLEDKPDDPIHETVGDNNDNDNDDNDNYYDYLDHNNCITTTGLCLKRAQLLDL